MQKFFKYQKTLISVIGLVISGTGSAQAISSFDDQAANRSCVRNILSGREVSDSFTQNGYINHVTSDLIAISSIPQIQPAKAVGQTAARGADLDRLDGWIVEDTTNDPPFAAEAYPYSDVLNVAADERATNVGADSLSTPIPFQYDGGVSKMLYAKKPIDGNREASPVPLPAAAWSFLIGLLGVLGLKRRKHPPAETI